MMENTIIDCEKCLRNGFCAYKLNGEIEKCTNYYPFEYNKQRSPWNMFRQYMFNYLGITREKIEKWIKQIIKEEVQKYMVGHNGIKGVVRMETRRALELGYLRRNDIKIIIQEEIEKYIKTNSSGVSEEALKILEKYYK